MTDKNSFWYHCSRCDSLFQTSLTPAGPRRCTRCGFDLNQQSTENKTPIPFARTVASVKSEQNAENKSVRLTVKRRKTSHTMAKLLIAWLIFAAVLIFVAHSIWNVESPKNIKVDQKSAMKEAKDKEDMAFLEASVPACREALSALLNSTLPEERNQFVYSPVTTIMRMTKHQDLNPFIQVNPPRPGASEWSVFSVGNEKVIECQWSSDEGKIFEVLFRKDKDSWKIDWEFLVRYSDIPFGIFLSGNGDAEGEFRLLARERLAEERKDMPTISLCLYAPITGRPQETGPQSPEFLVDRQSPAGRLLKAAFDARKRNTRPFGAELANQDPDSMIRIRAKIRRKGENETRSFEITELKACHWYSFDDAGLTIEPDEAPKN